MKLPFQSRTLHPLLAAIAAITITMLPGCISNRSLMENLAAGGLQMKHAKRATAWTEVIVEINIASNLQQRFCSIHLLVGLRLSGC